MRSSTVFIISKAAMRSVYIAAPRSLPATGQAAGTGRPKPAGVAARAQDRKRRRVSAATSTSSQARFRRSAGVAAALTISSTSMRLKPRQHDVEKASIASIPLTCPARVLSTAGRKARGSAKMADLGLPARARGDLKCPP
jgi:hypothetical protein